MPYQIVIHWNDGRSEPAAQGTREEVARCMPEIVTRIDPKQAKWELKYIPATAVISPTILASQMGALITEL